MNSTRQAGQRAWMARATSSPLIPGSIMSVTRNPSGAGTERTISRACSPSVAATTS